MSEASNCENYSNLSSSSDRKLVEVLLSESLNREKGLKRLLNEQLLKIDQLQLQLDMERKKTTLKGCNGLQKFKKTL